MQLVFDLMAKDNASRAFRQVGDEAERTGKRAGDGLNRMGAAAMAAGSLIAGAGLVKGFTELYQAADESRKIAARTENVIAQMGNAAGVSAKQVGDLAGAIAAKTGVDDEAIQSGQNLLLTFGNIKDAAGEGNDIFSQTSELMVDMAAAMGTDASGSAIQLGKALNDPIKGISALSRVGVSFTEDQKAMIRTLVETGDVMGAQKIILGELERQFGGAAEAMATPIDKLRVTSGNLVEELGGYLLPVVDELATSLNEGMLPSASNLGPKLADLTSEAAELVPQLIDMADQGLDLAVAVLPLLTSGLGLMLDIADRLGPALPYVVAGIAAMKVAGTVSVGVESLAGSMGRADGKMASFGRGLGAASIALPIVGAGVGVFVDAIHESDDALAANTALYGEWIVGMNEGGAAAAQVSADMERNRQVFQDVFNVDITETDEWTQALDNASEASRRHWEALNPLEQATQKVTEWTNTLSYALEHNGASSDEAKNAQERLAYWTDIQTGRQTTLDAAVATATTTTDTYTAGLEAASEAASDASRETNMLKTALDVLTGASVSMIEVESSYQAALAQATGALKEQNGTVLDGAGKLNLQSEAGRATADVLLGVRDSGNQLIATMVQQGRTSDEVGAAEARLRQDFINTAGQMGITGIQAETLADQILGIPGERKTTVTADTGQATSAISSLQAQIDGLRGRTVDIVARAIMPDLNGAASGSGRMGTYAEGGYTGNGGKYEPKGVVHGGEYVFTKEETAKAGVSNLASLARSLRGYATGGAVPPVSIAAELNARAYDSQMNGLARQVIDKYEPVQGFIGALQWARSQVGRPYVWGGVGPGGYDCSGFMSAITNVIRGRSPFSRVGSTASFPWAGFGGGAGGMFSIGSTNNAGGGIGHMAGTLLGVNVESTGGVGVKVGGSARGTNNGLFTTRASLYDSGGILPPGVTLAVNGTGKPETIRTAEQEAALVGNRPLDLSDRTIDRLAAAMIRGASAAVGAHGEHAAMTLRSWA